MQPWGLNLATHHDTKEDIILGLALDGPFDTQVSRQIIWRLKRNLWEDLLREESEKGRKM